MCNLGSIRDFVKATEFAQVLGMLEEDKAQGIRGDGKELLDNKRPKDAT
ncbi:MAG: hypothetical protein J1E83_01015 [Lachnospiraceae bacterium]|nr:hypothetical protein [Lachnospiraceae bacterium]